MKPLRKLTVLLVLVLVLVWARTAVFIIDETEIGILARFGRPLQDVREAGLHLKYPWPVDEVIKFDRRLLVFDPEPTEFLTQDKKNIIIDSYVCWRIGNPHQFLATVQDRKGAEARILDIATSELGATVGSHPITSFISIDQQSVKLSEISSAVTGALEGQASTNYGITVVDFRISGFNFPQQNRASVIKRMRAERNRIASKYRSEGEEEAMKIEADTEREKRQILAEAERKAEEIKGSGEAEAIRIYAEAYEKDTEFYRFMRTLEAYEKFIDDQTTILLESDSELMRLLTSGRTGKGD